MRHINIPKKVQKFVATLPVKHQKQIAGNMMNLQKEIHPQDSKKLSNSDYYRIDSGEYRIIYTWDDATVYIRIVGKRNDSDVYKKLKRGE